ncbi:MAG: hypothetical protein NTX87_06875 [Planctomycetota bacterium]|nr:hypothetical protein [Planctomycetota bacterium]
MKRLLLLAVILGAGVASARADSYTERYDTLPSTGGLAGATDFAAITGSPFGVQYDFYPQRASRRFAEDPFFGMVVGSMDEGFYWGRNAQLHGPGGYSCCMPPGDEYCDADKTGYLINGYGTGYGGKSPRTEPSDFLLGITFTDPGSTTGLRLTSVDSVKFGYAGGSNVPSAGVTVRGMVSDGVGGFVEVWTTSVDISYSSTKLWELVIPDTYAPVHRLEFDRRASTIHCRDGYHNPPPAWSAWYILDDLEFNVDNWVGNSGASGGYEWVYYDQAMYGGATYIPAPGALALGVIGLGLVGRLKRRFS